MSVSVATYIRVVFCGSTATAVTMEIRFHRMSRKPVGARLQHIMTRSRAMRAWHSYITDVAFHAAGKALLANWTASCRVFITSTTGQALKRSWTMIDFQNSITYYLHGTLRGLMITLCTTLLALKY